MTEKQHITIRIAGQAFNLETPRASVENLRKVERNLNKLWAKWSIDFPERTPIEVLAMVAFQYARYYYTLHAEMTAHEEALVSFEKKLDEILLNVE